MKRINKNGFTLIELLAVIIILGVLLLIAVPSVSKYIQNSRINTYESNLSKLVDAVSTEVNSYTNSDYTFGANEYLVVPLACIELERGSSAESPFGVYDNSKSFVLVDRKLDDSSNVIGFTYYVTAVDVSGFGAAIAEPTAVKVVASPEASVITESASAYSITNLPVLNGEAAKVVSCDAFTKDLS